MTAMTYIRKQYSIAALDDDKQRQRKLLNIIVTGLFALLFIGLIALLIASATKAIPADAASAAVFVAFTGVLIGCGLIYLVNNYLSPIVASIIIIAMLYAALLSADTAENLAQGRSVFFFIIPIILTAVLLPPSITFVTTTIAALIIFFIAISNQLVPSIPAITGFYMIALLSWLSSRTLNTTLHELRKLNVTLEERVVQRTQELNEALQQIIVESAKNEAVLASITDGILVFDRNQQITTANRAITRLINVPAGNTLGQSLKQLMDGHINSTEQEQVLALFNNTTPTDPIQINWDKKVFAVTFAPFLEASESTGANLLVFRDITDEAQLQRMKDSLMSMASHELRTPLNAIIGYSDMFSQGALGNLDPEQLNYIRRVMHNGKRMLTLVNNLLDSASHQAGLIKSHPSPTDIREVVKDVKETLEVLAEQHEIGLIADIEPSVPELINTDGQRLTQILMNLTSNAIKFTPDGKVSIAISCPDASHWSLKVIDTGIGIPPDALSYIFEPFRQVDGTIRRKHQGTGLGLSIVKDLVELLHGTISVESQPDQKKPDHGTTFTCLFPINTPTPEQAVTA